MRWISAGSSTAGTPGSGSGLRDKSTSPVEEPMWWRRSTPKGYGLLRWMPSTAAARIAKIQHLLGVDLTNPDERLALHLASRTTPTE